jgi:hypothetical protein
MRERGRRKGAGVGEGNDGANGKKMRKDGKNEEIVKGKGKSWDRSG